MKWGRAARGKGRQRGARTAINVWRGAREGHMPGSRRPAGAGGCDSGQGGRGAAHGAPRLSWTAQGCADISVEGQGEGPLER